MTDSQTITVYDQLTQDYVRLTRQDSPDPLLAGFVEHLRPGGNILDLGCGPGDAAAHLKALGFQVDAVDASPEMVRLARETHGLEARQALFEDISGNEIYDGVWANFSLLHARREDFATHLANVAAALKTGGILHLGMKIGNGERRDRLGRYYAYYSQAELAGHLDAAGFGVLKTTLGEDRGLAGNLEPWVVMLSRRTAEDLPSA